MRDARSRGQTREGARAKCTRYRRRMSLRAGQCPERESWQCVEDVQRAERGRMSAGQGRYRAHVLAVLVEVIWKTQPIHWGEARDAPYSTRARTAQRRNARTRAG
eukprot:2146952-Pleurochrysis_carterae.AAC.1